MNKKKEFPKLFDNKLQLCGNCSYEPPSQRKKKTQEIGELRFLWWKVKPPNFFSKILQTIAFTKKCFSQKLFPKKFYIRKVIFNFFVTTLEFSGRGRLPSLLPQTLTQTLWENCRILVIFPVSSIFMARVQIDIGHASQSLYPPTP